MPSLPSSGTAGTRSLQPPEGASVAIIIPAPGAIFSADEIPLQTLGGITPGAHTLELRVAAEDHRTELDATDRVEFLVE